MKNQQILTLFGLSEKEAQVYLTSLELGTASVYELANKSGLKRPTTYVVINELMQKGLVSLYKLKNKTYYTPLPVKKLLQRFQKQMNQLQSALPQLEKLETNSKSRPFVQFYEGKDGIAELYSELNPNVYKPKELLFFGNVGAIAESLPNRLEYWYKIIKDKRVRVRDLVSNTKENLNYINTIKAYELPHYETRIIPNKQQLGPIDIAVSNESVYIMSLIRDVFGIKIKHPLISETFKVWFNMAWEYGKKM